MRVMVMIKATPESEAGAMPTQEELEAMTEFNEQLVKAGVLLAGEGLLPSSSGVKVRWSGGEQTVIDGPFTEAKELVAGFWILQVSSMEEAVEWVKRVPNVRGTDAEIELRQIAEAEDFGEAYTPEIEERENRMRAQTEARSAS